MDYKNKFFPLDAEIFIKNLSHLIKKNRLEKNLRQIDLAEAIEVSLSTIKRIENADTSVETGALLKTIWYLGILDQLSHALPLVKDDELKNKRIRLSLVRDEDF
ncbi:helix-turn-helix transcriptional regulator [Acinetobacter sp. VNH17]|uniref:Helix-turn-helix transcriptional regulator n=1 Tax=Acinetobacter thutiue TaxID=2998078 RepID=A0ABT7WM84_9GAMM|nr:helix-turn-helix transcriptional regulator [Acinetobacter thutiue]MCY6411661.1 helix-turn-helix transcriptional regulator [Acinetobacter thutiue]MDN0013763.1 helix-turn-helix transcriptional regulator [Acinetobacter thutiue]